MFFTTKRKLVAANEQLRAKIRSMEQQLSTANVLLNTQKRELERSDKEIEALSQTIDGMETDLNNKKRSLTSSGSKFPSGSGICGSNTRSWRRICGGSSGTAYAASVPSAPLRRPAAAPAALNTTESCRETVRGVHPGRNM